MNIIFYIASMDINQLFFWRDKSFLIFVIGVLAEAANVL